MYLLCKHMYTVTIYRYMYMYDVQSSYIAIYRCVTDWTICCLCRFIWVLKVMLVCVSIIQVWPYFMMGKLYTLLG